MKGKKEKERARERGEKLHTNIIVTVAMIIVLAEFNYDNNTIHKLVEELRLNNNNRSKSALVESFKS